MGKTKTMADGVKETAQDLINSVVYTQQEQADLNLSLCLRRQQYEAQSYFDLRDEELSIW